ncbi:MAG: hypothetical protein JRI23_35270, partial [Deltaproteobacteria bacterium]|nr:hypothetical protein [Deltaproteobacteria bacterium]MBW2537580.1 hypothetical protein [Deltaproteobacteria bacterium]
GKDRKAVVPSAVPRLVPELTATLPIPSGDQPRQVHRTLPAAAAERIEPGEIEHFVVYATQNVELETCAVVPLTDEIPPPPPEPWQPSAPD